MADYSTLELRTSAGTETYELLRIMRSDGEPSPYQLAWSGWGPQTSRRSQRLIPDERFYEPVVEEMTITIPTPDTFGSLATLQTFVEEVWRWSQRTTPASLAIHYQPHGSNLANPLTAVIWDAEIVGLPADYDAGDNFWLRGITLRLTRLGVWLGEEETMTAAGNASSSQIVTLATASADQLAAYSPTRLSFNSNLTKADFGNLEGRGSFGKPLILATDRRDGWMRRYVVADDFPTSSRWTLVNDASRLPANGSTVMRYTPTDTLERRITTPIGSIDAAFFYTPQTLYVAATLGVADVGTVAVRAVARTIEGGSDADIAQTPQTFVSSDDPDARQARSLGLLHLPPAWPGNIRLVIAAQSLNGTTRLDIDTVVVMALTPASMVVVCDWGNILYRPWGGFDDSDVIIGSIDPRLDQRATLIQDAAPHAFVGFRADTTKQVQTPYDGNPYLWSRAGSGVDVCLLGTSSGRRWRLANEFDGSLMVLTYTGARRKAYLTPQ